MWTRKNTILTSLAVLLAIPGIYGYKLIWGKPFIFNHFGQRAMFLALQEDPERFTAAGMLDGTFLDFHSGKLTDSSPRQAVKVLAHMKRELATLKSYDRERLSKEEQLSYDVLRQYLEPIIEGEAFPYDAYGLYPVNPVDGVQAELPKFMATMHRVNDLRSAKRYLARLAAVPRKFDQLLETLRMRETMGAVPPRFILAHTLKQIQAFVNLEPEQNPFYQGLERGLGALQGLDPGTRRELLAQARELVADKIYPAYRSLEAVLQRQQRTADDRAGVWRLPNGEAYYRYLLKLHTTTDLSPEQIHALGLREVARLDGELREAFSRIGYRNVTPAEGFARLARDPQQHYTDDEAGRKALLSDAGTITAEMEAGLRLFMPIPMPSRVAITPIPKHQEATSPMALASPGSLDGTRPATFFINLRNPGEFQKFALRTLAFHEGLPGHLYQGSFMQSLKDLPTVRSLIAFTAYDEGWALYVERLAWEQGFQKDPFSNLGRLQAEQWRAARLVVDTGLHHQRWSREQAIAYLLEKTGMPEAEVTIEVDRYIVWPGQACAYMVGMLKLLELREEVKKAQSSAFDLKAFHRMVLNKGSLPLWILEREVREELHRSLPQSGQEGRARL